MLKKKWIRIALHAAVWIVYFTLPHLMRPAHGPRGRGGHRHGPGQGAPQPFDWNWMLVSTLQNLLLVPVFYLNVYYILPRLLRARRYALLIAVQVAGMALHYGYAVLIGKLLIGGGRSGPPLYISMTSYLLIFSIAYGYYAFRESRKWEAVQKEREMEGVKAELQFLRWQISPHFLFNALNNMVAMARKKSDDLEPTLIHLSGLMRYMLYETEGSRVSLRKETEYLRSYIHLQAMRYSDVQLETALEVPEYSELYIEPMLLIPFVENAFKHGIDLIPDPVIEVRLAVDGHTLHFDVRNKYRPGSGGANKDEVHGIGLANVEKRLNLLYAGRHTLETKIDTWYTVHLTIELA